MKKNRGHKSRETAPLRRKWDKDAGGGRQTENPLFHLEKVLTLKGLITASLYALSKN